MSVTAGSEAFERFARAHLGDRVERAVYAVVAAHPAREWAVREVAAHARVSHHEADQALRRFAAAGIVARIDLPGRSDRYRWILEMRDLADGPSAAGQQPIDPVCGMPVPPDSPHVAHDGDLDVRFCSLPCLVRWNASTRKAERRSPGTSSVDSRGPVP